MATSSSPSDLITVPRVVAPSFDAGVLAEPRLLFGGGQEHVDPKFGLGLFGPYCPAAQTSPPLGSIRVGVVGPSDSVSDTEAWLEACRQEVRNDGAQPRLAPHFVGIAASTPFQCRLVTGDPMRVTLTQGEMKQALAVPNFHERIKAVARLYADGIGTLAQREPKPNVIVCALSQDVVDLCATRKAVGGEVKRLKTPKAERKAKESVDAGQGFLFREMDPTAGADEDAWTHSDLRRAIKVLAMQHGMPTQLAWPRSIAIDDEEGQKAQDRASRAWNFITGLYYKAGGMPWRWAGAAPNTCFVGIAFYRESQDPQSRLRTALAQTFTSSGDGYVLRGRSFTWDADREKSRSPHLDRASAEELMKQVVAFNAQQNERALPARIVVHKSSRYWEDELEGFRAGCAGVPRVDLVALQWRGVQFFRTGQYPPLRGTYVKFSPQNQLLYTTGYVPLQRSYNGPRVPQPLEVVERHGDTPWRDVLSEILGLTKLNWNSAAFSVSEPITLAFARRVGSILAEIRPEQRLENDYRFYM